MCGIAGFLGLKRQTSAQTLATSAAAMGYAQIHCGPHSGDVSIDKAADGIET